MELAKTMVVSQQTYAATLSGPLSNQVAALKQPGTGRGHGDHPGRDAFTMLPASSIGYFPQYVISNVGSDAPTVGPLLEALTKAGGGGGAQAAAATGLLKGVISSSTTRPVLTQNGNSKCYWLPSFSILLIRSRKRAPVIACSRAFLSG